MTSLGYFDLTYVDFDWRISVFVIQQAHSTTMQSISTPGGVVFHPVVHILQELKKAPYSFSDEL